MKTSRGGISRIVWAEAFGVVLILLALYGCTISANLCIAHDSIHYINTIDDGRNLYHPHHLLYAPLARLWVQTWRGLGAESVDSAALVSALNAIFGALTCGMVFVFCRARLNLERGQSLVGSSLAACSFGMWYYSVCVEVYVIPAFWLFVTLLILTGRRLGIGSCVAMRLTCGLAVLFHQTNVLFGLPVVAGVATASGKPVRRRLLAIAAFIGTGMIVTCVPYAIVLLAFVEADSWAHAWRWLTEYAQGAQWGTFGSATIPKAVIGFGRSIVGGHFLFASPQLASAVGRFLGEHYLADERFLVRHMPTWQAWAYLTTGLTACVFAVLAVGRRLLGRLRGLNAEAPARRLLVILVAWLVVYAGFFAWWEPENLEFWIAPSLAFWMIVLTILSSTARPPAAAQGTKGSRGQGPRDKGAGATQGAGATGFFAGRGDSQRQRYKAGMAPARRRDGVAAGDESVRQHPAPSKSGQRLLLSSNPTAGRGRPRRRRRHRRPTMDLGRLPPALHACGHLVPKRRRPSR